nr:facilitated trehalose transporter Tret1-like [Leptinotarsa decemlineata]
MVVLWENALFYNKGNLFQYIATITGAVSIMSSGINLGWTSPYLPKITSITSTIPTTSAQGSWCAIAPLLGSPFGALIAVYLADKIGRKFTTLLMAPIVFICFIFISIADSIWVITALRFIIGATEGGSYTALPMYIGEISNPEIRGFLTATIAIFAITGTLLINIIGSMMDIFTSSLVCAMIPVIHFAAFVLMPESPYYYIKKHNMKDARRSLEILRGTSNVDNEMNSLRIAVSRQERSEKSGVLDLFTVPNIRKATYIFLILCLTNKFSGKNPCMFYTETIFKETGSNINPTLSVVVYCTVELIAVASATFFIVDRFGKRKLMITSTAGCALSVFMLSLHFYLKDFHVGIVDKLNWLPITALTSYNIFFSIGLAFGPVTVLSELFPTNIKAKALGIADTFSVLMGALVSKIFQIALDEFETMFVPFFFFSMCSCVGLIFVIKYVPETKGKTLEEIQQYLIAGKN